MGSGSRKALQGNIATHQVNHNLYRSRQQLTHLSRRCTQGHQRQGEGDWKEGNNANQPMYNYSIADKVAFGDEECSHFQHLQVDNHIHIYLCSSLNM